MKKYVWIIWDDDKIFKVFDSKEKANDFWNNVLTENDRYYCGMSQMEVN